MCKSAAAKSASNSPITSDVGSEMVLKCPALPVLAVIGFSVFSVSFCTRLTLVCRVQSDILGLVFHYVIVSDYWSTMVHIVVRSVPHWSAVTLGIIRSQADSRHE